MNKSHLIFILLIHSGICLADGQMYGTAAQPLINGQAYDVHKTYIEPNQGYGDQSKNDVSETGTRQVVAKSSAMPVKPPVNFKDDNWAYDSKIGNVLKQAASDGKLGKVLIEAQKANVPPVVAVVPIAESHYNNKAISPKGAGGAWQIMPATANEYGLSSDQRFDFNASTEMAVGMLKDLHNTFGSWSLAFAAYNCGTQCVINALRKNPNARNIDDLRLPQETRDYVHKIVWYSQLIAGLDKTDSINN